MAQFVQDCPRCAARSTTFDTCGDVPTSYTDGSWSFEVLGRCRNCGRCSIANFETKGPAPGEYNVNSFNNPQLNLGGFLTFDRFVSIADQATLPSPEYLPTNVANCYREGAASFNIGAYNAAAAMFRLALDLATKSRLPAEPSEDGGPNNAQRNRLFDRLEYLFEKRIIAPELRPLADCVREDGNDGAHDGTLTKADAEDLIDFTQQLLERVYTEPARLRIAKERRDARRSGVAEHKI